MTPQKLFDEYVALPVEAQRQVADFIAFLQQRYTSDHSKKLAKTTWGKNLSSECGVTDKTYRIVQVEFAKPENRNGANIGSYFEDDRY